MNRSIISIAAITILAAVSLGAASALAQTADTDWPAFNGTYTGDRYSPLTQIDTKNVATSA